jgi:F-type H+-transporting ATPase subunit delta
MKTTPQAIARALIETCQSLSENEYSALIDASLLLLESSGNAKAIRIFPRIVRDQLGKRGMILAEVTTPAPESTEWNASFAATLEKSLGKSVELSATLDPTLLGGALLQLGDERFDASLRGALDVMHQHLAQQSLTAA